MNGLRMDTNWGSYTEDLETGRKMWVVVAVERGTPAVPGAEEPHEAVRSRIG